jgi:hypothetical protein
MATPNQIRANRANALRSTGPVTEKGKQIASRNSIRHGMVSQTVVLEGESQDRFIDLLTSLTLQLKPRNDAEAAIIETMAIARWKQMRIWGIQKAGFDLEMAQLNSSCTLPPARAYMVFKNLADNSRVLDLQHRYETGYDRQFCRAYAFFLKLREKPETLIEDSDFSQMSFSFATATWEPAPEQTQETPAPPEVPDGKNADQQESQNEAPGKVGPAPGKPAQNADLASAQSVLRNEPDFSEPSIHRQPNSASNRRPEPPQSRKK